MLLFRIRVAVRALRKFQGICVYEAIWNSKSHAVLCTKLVDDCALREIQGNM